MARRRPGRAFSRFLALLLFGAAVFGVGVWLGQQRGARGGARRAAPAPAAARPQRPGSRPAAPAPAPPAAPTVVTEPSGPPTRARVALVIDDLGRSLETADRLLALGAPVTGAVLPFERHSAEVAARLRAGGAEVIVHLPMEPTGDQDPGPQAVLERWRPERIAALTERAIAAVPGAAGLNNHMGSRITADEEPMRAILGVVARHGLYFLDSRTTAETRAFDWAREAGIPAARRDVFLDDDEAPGAIAGQFERLLEQARARGAAIAIGHPHDGTLAVLGREIPAARAAGVEFVPVSYLLERSENLPE